MAEKYNIFGKGGGQTGKIMRTVYFTICEGDELDERNAKARDFYDVLVGKYKPKRATRHFNHVMPGHRIRIHKTTIYQQLVGMDFWEFWQYAEASYDPVKVDSYVFDTKID